MIWAVLLLLALWSALALLLLPFLVIATIRGRAVKQLPSPRLALMDPVAKPSAQ